MSQPPEHLSGAVLWLLARAISPYLPRFVRPYKPGRPGFTFEYREGSPMPLFKLTLPAVVPASPDALPVASRNLTRARVDTGEVTVAPVIDGEVLSLEEGAEYTFTLTDVSENGLASEPSDPVTLVASTPAEFRRPLKPGIVTFDFVRESIAD